ncbi:Inter-alpha-trypsin inhibitor heavy chain H2, partial [Eschrichtius robustus]|nr:Inter-alpha-trypsin inhibitor heavy chain H2 [Eschrichtius robustus]
KFYNQVSTPLLRNVQFNYPQTPVTDVTQNSFHNYFGGSEIVVAGKVDPDKLEQLQSIITATSANAELVLETLAKMDGLEDFLSKDKHADPDFTKKLWAYLTINQLLAERPKVIFFTLSLVVMLQTEVPPLPSHITSNYGALVKGSAWILVNGQLIGAKKPKNEKLSTYFGKLGFYFQREGMKIEISTETISLSRGSRTSVLSWSDTAHVLNQRVLVSVKKEKTVTIALDKEMSFSVLLHRVWKKHPVNVDFLGIYIPPTNKFSPNVHGLIGQFMYEPKIRIFNERPGKDPEKPEANMEVKGQKLIVTRGLQKDYRTDRVFGTDVPCWFVHNSGKGFIDGHYKDYFVPQLYSFLKWP